MAYNGIIGDIELLIREGVLTDKGIDQSKFDQKCLKKTGSELVDFANSYDRICQESESVGFVGEVLPIIMNIFDSIFGGGGKKEASCPPCPPPPTKNLMDYAAPAIMGFGVGYLILK